MNNFKPLYLLDDDGNVRDTDAFVMCPAHTSLAPFPDTTGLVLGNGATPPSGWAVFSIGQEFVINGCVLAVTHVEGDVILFKARG